MNSRYSLQLTRHLMPILMFIGLLLSYTASAVTITVQADRNPVNPNESVQLIFSAKEDPDGDPDFSPLYEDFDVLNQQRSSNVSMINGDVTRNYTWTLNVMPKNSGKLMIPPISFGSDQSSPSTLVVRKNQRQTTHGNAVTDEKLFLEVEASPTDPYVQEQVIYTLKLYRRVGISQASLTEPELDNAVIEKLGEDRNYSTLINGSNYTVTERKYAIFPQQSGPIRIAPLTLTAQVLTGQRSRFDGFFGSQSTRTQRIRSKAIELNVKAAPENFTASHWLPAQQVLLQQQWSGNLNTVKVGEPLTRTLTLIAKGVTVSQLPEILDTAQNLTNTNQDELKTYPDQPVLKEQPKGDGVISLREEKIAYIPSSTGTYQIPETRIPWWNTETGKMEVAVLPAQTLTAVGPAQQNASSQIPPPASSPERTPSSLPLAAETQMLKAEASIQTEPFWMWFSLFLGLGWLATVFYFMKNRQADNEPDELDRSKIFDLSTLQQACRENDAQTAKDALIEWGRENFNVSSLGALVKLCPEPLKEEINRLNQHLYSQNTEAWQGGDILLKQFKLSIKQLKTKEPREGGALQPLYKI